jgi:hypothetical protein
MKKLIVLISSTVLFSCNGSDVRTKLTDGIWKVSGLIEGSKIETDKTESFTIKFNDDGSVSSSDPTFLKNWKYASDSLCMSDDKQKLCWNVGKLDKDNLELVANDPNTGKKITLLFIKK